EGKFDNALRKLWQIYHESQFTDATSNTSLESYQPYGGNIPAYGGLAALANLSFTFTLGAQTVRAELHPVEKRFVALRAATVYVMMGDLQYRQGQTALAQRAYMQALRILSAEWKTLIVD